MRPGLDCLEWSLIDVTSASRLERPFDIDEIKELVFYCCKDKEVGLVESFEIGRDNISISHLQFADDTLIFPYDNEQKFLNLQ